MSFTRCLQWPGAPLPSSLGAWGRYAWAMALPATLFVTAFYGGMIIMTWSPIRCSPSGEGWLRRRGLMCLVSRWGRRALGLYDARVVGTFSLVAKMELERGVASRSAQ